MTLILLVNILHHHHSYVVYKDYYRNISSLSSRFLVFIPMYPPYFYILSNLIYHSDSWSPSWLFFFDVYGQHFLWYPLFSHSNHMGKPSQSALLNVIFYSPTLSFNLTLVFLILLFFVLKCSQKFHSNSTSSLFVVTQVNELPKYLRLAILSDMY